MNVATKIRWGAAAVILNGFVALGATVSPQAMAAACPTTGHHCRACPANPEQYCQSIAPSCTVLGTYCAVGAMWCGRGAPGVVCIYK